MQKAKKGSPQLKKAGSQSTQKLQQIIKQQKEEIQFLRQNSQRNQEFKGDENFSKILNHQKQLESSLRSEILQNEQKDRQIEILKQALETKMIEIGAQNLEIQDFISFTKHKSKSDKLDSLILQLKSTVKDQKAQLQQAFEDNQALKQKIDQHYKQEAELKQTIESKQESLENCYQEIQSILREKKQLIEQNKQLQESYNTLDDDYNELIQEQDDFKQSFNILMKENKALQKQVDELNKEKENLQDKLRQYEEFRLSYLTTEKKLQQSGIESKQKQDQVDKLSNQVTCHRQQSDLFKEELETKTMKFDELNEAYIELNNQYEITLGQLAIKNGQVEDLQKLKKENNQRIQQLEKEKQQLQEKLDLQKQQLIQSIEDLTDQLQQSKFDYEAIEKEYQRADNAQKFIQLRAIKLQQEIENQKQQYQKLQESIVVNEGSLSQYTLQSQNQSNKIYELSEEVSNLKFQIDLDNEKLQNQSDEILKLQQYQEDLSQALSTANRNFEEKQNQSVQQKDQIEILKQQIQELQYKSDKYQNQWQELLYEKETLNKKLEQYTDTNINYSLVTENYNQITDCIYTFCCNYTQLCAVQSMYKDSITELLYSQILHWSVHNLTQHQEVIDWLNTVHCELEKLIDQVQAKQDEKQQVEHKIQIVNNKLISFEEQYESIQQEKQSVHEKLQHANKLVQNYRLQSEQDRKKTQQLEHSYKQLKDQNEDLISDYLYKTNTVSEIQEKMEILEGQHKEAKLKLNDFENSYNLLNSHLQECTDLNKFIVDNIPISKINNITQEILQTMQQKHQIEVQIRQISYQIQKACNPERQELHQKLTQFQEQLQIQQAKQDYLKEQLIKAEEFERSYQQQQINLNSQIRELQEQLRYQDKQLEFLKQKSGYFNHQRNQDSLKLDNNF